MKILILEDNESIREAVASFLTLEDHEIIEAATVKEARELSSKEVDLYLLDIMLPDGNGYIFAREIRSREDTPIIFLTAKESESERIKGFEIGCDDYITKPFSLKELSLRINVIFRRVSAPKTISDDLNFQRDGFKMKLSMDKYKLDISGKEVILTQTEWLLLTYLIKNRSIVLSKERILENCLDYSRDSSDRVVITHIKNLREKLGEGRWIETVRGFGYRFSGEE